jgi:hypothetical protein
MRELSACVQSDYRRVRCFRAQHADVTYAISMDALSLTAGSVRAQLACAAVFFTPLVPFFRRVHIRARLR